MATIKQKTKAGLVKKYHTLAGKAGLDDMAKDAILASYGVESSKDLTVEQLIELCETLDSVVHPEADKIDCARKRLMAAVGGWLRAMGKAESDAIIKGIISRASGGKDINRLSEQKLNSMYSAFCKATKDVKIVRTMTILDIKERTTLN